jgi:hypothetical protein
MATDSGNLPMTEKHTPDYLSDISAKLSVNGIASDGIWYHGTASGLVDAIVADGLIGGGDSEFLNRTQQTLGTIGGRQFESKDPVFITQSKELAYYWAEQKTRARNIYFQKDETPVVFAINLPSELADKVKPDVGAAALVMEPGNDYVTKLQELYIDNGITLNEVNPLQVDRSYFLQMLAMAYIQDQIPATALTLLKA